MFFSSGAAQTNGGGSFCIETYSLLNYAFGKPSCTRNIRRVDRDETYTLVSSLGSHGGRLEGEAERWGGRVVVVDAKAGCERRADPVSHVALDPWRCSSLAGLGVKPEQTGFPFGHSIPLFYALSSSCGLCVIRRSPDMFLRLGRCPWSSLHEQPARAKLNQGAVVRTLVRAFNVQTQVPVS